MYTSFTIKCPVCGKVTQVSDEVLQFVNEPKIRLCEPEDGGCDYWFAYRPVVTIRVHVSKLDNQLGTPG